MPFAAQLFPSSFASWSSGSRHSWAEYFHLLFSLIARSESNVTSSRPHRVYTVFCGSTFRLKPCLFDRIRTEGSFAQIWAVFTAVPTASLIARCESCAGYICGTTRSVCPCRATPPCRRNDSNNSPCNIISVLSIVAIIGTRGGRFPRPQPLVIYCRRVRSRARFRNVDFEAKTFCRRQWL